MNPDVVVVGAGPAGLIAARESAKRGAEVTVLEEHGEVGVPCHCAGLLSLKGLVELGLPQSSDFIQNRLRGARFHSPSGFSFTVEGEEAVACVVDRGALDKFLARQAARAGADVRMQSRVRRIRRLGRRIEVSGPWGSMDADVVVDAEGVGSRLVREAGLTPLGSQGVLPAIQFEVADVEVDSAYAEVYVGEKVAPGFFAWVLPLKGDMARVGLACRGADPRERLESFVGGRFGRFNRVSVRSGSIITCGPIPRTFSDNLVVVGDAAGQVKPTTGGGVILGGICASIAGRVVVEAVRRSVFAADFLGEYERLWSGRLGREFRVMRLARRVMDRLSDGVFDKVFRVVVDGGLQAEFSRIGDVDFQAGVLSALARKRDVVKVLLAVVPGLVKGFAVGFDR